jgi:hypothetical protein
LTVHAGQAPSPGRGASLFNLKTATLGLIIVVDQLLLPMFHLGPIPVKISYALLGLWLFSLFVNPADRSRDTADRRDFRRFAQAIAGIVMCALMGEIVLGFFHPVFSYSDTMRSVLIYTLWVLAFGMGLSSWTFNLRWLIWVFYTSIALNMAFIVLREQLPSFLIHFYYSSTDVTSLSINGVQTVEDIIQLARPRGLFLNPNVSMSLINVIVVFIYVAIRERLIAPPGTIGSLGIVVLPIAMAGLLASRSEFVVSVLLGIANSRVLLRNLGPARRARLVALGVVLLAAAAVGLAYLAQDAAVTDDLARLNTILSAADNASSKDLGARAASVARPLLMVEVAAARFAFSPLFGSGFSSSPTFPFDLETQYFHNDWFRLIVTSGILGVLLMLGVIRSYFLPLGAMVVVPFALPGLTNTFMLNIPAMIFYLFMVGVLRKTLRMRNAGSGAAA